MAGGSRCAGVASRRDDADLGRALLAVGVVGAGLGWFSLARDFVAARLPLFLTLAAALAALVVLVLRRRLAARRLRAANQRRLDAQVASTDGMSGPGFERVIARLMARDGFTDVRIPEGAATSALTSSRPATVAQWCTASGTARSAA